jgi:hypothetical protein
MQGIIAAEEGCQEYRFIHPCLVQHMEDIIRFFVTGTMNVGIDYHGQPDLSESSCLCLADMLFSPGVGALNIRGFFPGEEGIVRAVIFPFAIPSRKEDIERKISCCRSQFLTASPGRDHMQNKHVAYPGDLR